MGEQLSKTHNAITMMNNSMCKSSLTGATCAENDDSLTAITCESFASEVAAKKSVPGGGGTAAYVGALAASLCSMAGNFTLGKIKYADVEDDILRLLDVCERVRLRLLELVDEDARAFYPLSKAYSIPKDDLGRAQQIEKCTKAAINPPLEMMHEIAKAIEALEEMQKKGSRMLQSDVGCGAALAAGAMQAASLNVFVNTKALQDRDFACQVEGEASELLDYATRAQAVFDKVNAEIRGD